MILWLAGQALAEGPCADDTRAELDRAMQEVHAAWRALDTSAFDRAALFLDGAVACLDAVPPVPQIARLHQTQALRSYSNGQNKATLRSLRAARTLDPSWSLPEDLFPRGNTYYNLFEEAVNPSPVVEIGEIEPESWTVDGYKRAEAPTDAAFLLQVEAAGEVVWTGYLLDFAEIPERGQSELKDPQHAPRLWSIELAAVGRGVVAEQAAASAGRWSAQRAFGAGAGVETRVRYTPNAIVGGEISAAAFGPDDPVVGGGLSPELLGVVQLGRGMLLGPRRAWIAGRLGGATEVHRAWPNGAIGPVTEAWRILAAAAGVQVGIRDERSRLDFTSDYLFAGGYVPYELHTRLGGALALSESTALQGSTQFRMGGLGYEDERGRDAGRRDDLDFRLAIGLAYWID